jgi:hypothetical protein
VAGVRLLGPGCPIPVELGRAERDEVAAALDGLAVRGDGPASPGVYQRKDLAIRWARFAGLGFDTKDLVFGRFLAGVEFDPDWFTARRGLLAEDFYTGDPVEFAQAEDRKDWQIEIDHVVSLSDAFASGGHRWSPRGRNWQKIANDVRNLMPVARAVNRAKGDKNAAEWLPPNPRTDFRPRFVAMQITVKAAYRLSVTESELAAMRAVLAEA